MTVPQRPLTVGDLMTPDPIVIRADAPLAEAVGIFDLSRVHGLPVVDAGGLLVGVLSQTDLVRARATEHLWSSWPGLAVRHLMTSPALTAGATMSMEEAAHLMEERHVHRLVVVGEDEETPIGVISAGDIVRAMAEAIRDA